MDMRSGIVERLGKKSGKFSVLCDDDGRYAVFTLMGGNPQPHRGDRMTWDGAREAPRMSLHNVTQDVSVLDVENAIFGVGRAIAQALVGD
jgi:hypothetical protein